MQPDFLTHVVRLQGLALASQLHDIVVDLRGLHGREVGGVTCRNADTAWLEEAQLGAVQAVRRQLIIPERAEQLAHEDVRLLRSLPLPHVAGHDLHLGAVRLPFLQHAVAQCNHSVGILLDGENTHLPLGPAKKKRR